MARVTKAAIAAAAPTEPEVLAYTCPECDAPQVFRIAHRHVQYTSNMDMPEEYTYAVCPECAGPVVLVRENYGNGFDETGYSRAYPALNRRLSFDVPKSVRHSYDEAVRCEQSKAWTAEAVMVGRALEAICTDFDPSVRSIHDGLQRMLAAGAISQELHDWGDGLRLVRNEGAHAGPERISANDAKVALDFLQALIEILFDLRARFAEWQQDRAARAATRKARSGKAAKQTKATAIPKT